jgi:hypothetical protein
LKLGSFFGILSPDVMAVAEVLTATDWQTFRHTAEPGMGLAIRTNFKGRTMHKKILTSFVGASLLMLGCPAEDDTGATASETNVDSGDDDDNETGSDTAPGTSGVSETSGMSTDPQTTGATDDPSDTDSDPSQGSITNSFIEDPDGNSVSIECSVWEQDCMEGEKCMPWANDGGNSWNATRCSPVAPDPGQVGDPCTVEGSGVSGVDDCAIATMCWGVDPETNQGTCTAFCMGSENNPVCDNPQTACSIANEGTLILCLPTCDPLLQNCMDGEGCWGIDDDFVCAPDAGAEGEGAYGEACEFLNVCDPGLFCANPDIVPGCQASGCCSEFCDLSDPQAGANCAGAGGGQECLPWFEEGQSPPGYEDVGACGIPA